MSSKLRMILTMVLLGGLGLGVYLSGVTEGLTVEGVREQVAATGPWAVLVYFLVFWLGVLAYVPGSVFVLPGILLFGRVWGVVWALSAGLSACWICVTVIRALGGQPLADTQKPWLRKAMDGLERHPIRSVALIRTMLWMSAMANIPLAFSPVKQRDHLIGSALGLGPGIILTGVFFDEILAWLQL